MYRLSARQVLAVALLSALFAAGAIALVDRMGSRFQPSGSAFSEATPAGISDPANASAWKARETEDCRAALDALHVGRPSGPAPAP